MPLRARSSRRHLSPVPDLQPVTGDVFAAAEDIDVTQSADQRMIRSALSHSRRAAARSWMWYHSIGEVHYAVSRSARVAGYAKLQAVRRAPNGEIDGTIDTGLPAEIVASMYGATGGTRGLIERFYTLMRVPGDSFLIAPPKNGEYNGLHFASPDELDTSSFAWWKPGEGRVRWITLPAGGGEGALTVDLAAKDVLGRVWSPSQQYLYASDTALRAMDTECEALYLLTKTIKAKLMSRFALAGLLVLPPGISTVQVERKGGQVVGKQLDDAMTFLVSAMQRNVRNWDTATTYMPIMLRTSSAEDIERIKHITMDREVFETDLALRQELIERILTGFDANQDQVRGTKDQSHWSAWASSDEERRVAVQPDLETMCWGLEKLVFRRRLLEAKTSPEDIMSMGVWFDLSAAAVKSNMQEDGRQAFDRILVGPAAARRMSGIAEQDAPTEEEEIRAVGRQIKNPMLALHKGGVDDIDWDKVSEWGKSTGPAPDSPAEDPESGPGEGDPGSPDDRETDVPRSQRPA